MDFTFHRPYKTELLSANAAADLFELRMLYREGGNWQVRDRVHVPESVQAAFRHNEVVGFHLETLGMNSVASRALSESPQFAVLGVELINGRQLNTTPAPLIRARRNRLFLFGLLATAGAFGAVTPLAWFGGLLTGASVQVARTAFSIRVTPFWPPARGDSSN